jgi:uncharacterized protein YndB with AHSA1/START domain
MTDALSTAFSETSKVIKAPRESLYNAFTDPAALIAWLPPGEMTGKIYSFAAHVGGGYEMSLFYPPSEQIFIGKTSETEDRFTSRFVELEPPSKIIQAITFISVDLTFSGEMTMVVTFEVAECGTNVTVKCKDIPAGIRPEDNDAGCRSSLDKLASYIELGRPVV